MTELTAIDILINPDEHALARARKVNARVLESMPEGWVLEPPANYSRAGRVTGS